MAEQVILEVNVSSLVQSVTNAKDVLQGYKDALKVVIEQNGEFSKEATIAKAQVDAQSKAFKQLEGQLTRVVQAEEANNKSLKDLVKNGYDPANKTIDQNRKVLNALTAEYVKASKEQRERLVPTIRSISDELKKQEGAIGDNRRNVGNYAESIKDAAGSLNLFGVGLGNVIQSVSGGINAFQSAGGGIKGLGAAFGGLGLAMPAVSLALGGIISAFEKYAPLADFVEQQTAGVAAAFGALVSGGSITDAYNATVEYTAAIQDLGDELEIVARNQQEYNNYIDEYILQSKDRTKTDQERIDLLDKASNLERVAFKERVEQNKRELKITEDLFKERAKLTEKELLFLREGTKEQQLEIQRNRLENASIETEIITGYFKLLTERAKLEGESLQVQTKISITRNDLLEQQKKDQDAAFEKEKAQRDKALEEQERYNSQLEQLESEFILSERERLEKSFNDKLLLIKGNGQREILLRLSIEAEKQNALDEFDRKQQEAAAKKEEERQRAIGQRLLQDMNDAKQAQSILASNAEKQLEIQRLFNATQEEIDREFAESSFSTFSDYYAAKKKLYEDDAKANADASRKNIENINNQIAARQAELSATQSITSGIIGLIGTTAEALGAGAEFQKAIAFTQVLIQQAIAIANAVAGATASGLGTGPAAIATTPVFIATLVGSVVSVFGSLIGLFSKANVPDAPKFERGGAVEVGGELHSSGGTKYVGEDGNVFEVERGEKIYVLNRMASKHIDALGGLNMAFGGRSWSDSPIRYAANGGQIQDGGFGIRQTSEQANNNVMVSELIKSVVSKMPTPVVSVVEIDRVRDKRSKAINISELK